MPSKLFCACLGALLMGPVQSQTAYSYKNLGVVVTAVERGIYVSLIDCPPGANIVHGYIRPFERDQKEYITVTANFTVLEGFTPGVNGRISLHDTQGHVYYTAQAFSDIDTLKHFTCTFSFRVPKNTQPASMFIDKTAFALKAIAR